MNRFIKPKAVNKRLNYRVEIVKWAWRKIYVEIGNIKQKYGPNKEIQQNISANQFKQVFLGRAVFPRMPRTASSALNAIFLMISD